MYCNTCTYFIHYSLYTVGRFRTQIPTLLHLLVGRDQSLFMEGKGREEGVNFFLVKRGECFILKNSHNSPEESKILWTCLGFLSSTCIDSGMSPYVSANHITASVLSLWKILLSLQLVLSYRTFTISIYLYKGKSCEGSAGLSP